MLRVFKLPKIPIVCVQLHVRNVVCVRSTHHTVTDLLASCRVVCGETETHDVTSEGSFSRKRGGG